MKVSAVKRDFTRLMGKFLCVSLVIGFGFFGTVSADCGGSSESDYASDSYVANWDTMNDKTLEAQITQENLLMEKLKQEKTVLEKALQDKMLDQQTVLEKNSQLAALNDKISQAQTKLDTLIQAGNVQKTMYQVTLPTSGGGITGLKVKFPNALKAPPGADYLSYTISPYSAKLFAEQKLVAVKTFNQTQNQFTPKVLLKACSERLGSYLCTKGTKVAF